MRLLVFGGTTEGRVLAEELAHIGHQVTVSVATPLGAEELSRIACTVWQGRMDEAEMAARMREFDLVIDATHPYAEVVSEYIRAACAETGVPLRRVLREAAAGASCTVAAVDDNGNADTDPDGMDCADAHEDVVSRDRANAGTGANDIEVAAVNRNCIRVTSCREAADYLRDRTGNVLVTTGSKALRDYNCLAPERLYPRVLPTHEALNICEEMRIPHRNILALQGPFSLEMNVAMLRQYAISYLVTKDGGRAGGYEEKQQAAEQTGVQLILVGRPADHGESMEQLLAELEQQAEVQIQA